MDFDGFCQEIAARASPGQSPSPQHQQDKSWEQMLQETIGYSSAASEEYSDHRTASVASAANANVQQQQQQQQQQQLLPFYGGLDESLGYANASIGCAHQASNFPSVDMQQQQQQQQQQPWQQQQWPGGQAPAYPNISGLSLSVGGAMQNGDNFNCAGAGFASAAAVSNAQQDCAQDAIVALRQWVLNENEGQTIRQRKEHLLRKTTVAYGISALVCHAASSGGSLECDLDNFVVLVSPDSTNWDNVAGVAMVSPATNLSFHRPLFQSGSFFDEKHDDESPQHNFDDELDCDGLGRNLEVSIDDLNLPTDGRGATNEECRDNVCHNFGLLLYELFAKKLPFDAKVGETSMHAPTKTPEDERSAKRRSGRQESEYTSLVDLGFPAALSLLVESLTDCAGGVAGRPSDAYPSMEAVRRDLHLFNKYPNRFFFDRMLVTNDDKSSLLRLRKNRLYGRDAQALLIKEAFCRVSLTGQSECLFVKGYSGSGKTKLVQSVMENVNIAGGYVIAQKYDQMQQGRPLSAIISALNQLPLLILEKNSQQEIDSIVKDFAGMFGPYLSNLPRVIPNITALIPYLKEIPNNDNELNFDNLHFILLLFVRVVSSKDRPVMLFLDDLHWASSVALDLIHAILSDMPGSNCLFFVGSYRSNEVNSDHAIFDFINKLPSLNIPTSTINLDGITAEELNELVADSLCTLPQRCVPLSQIVHSKTKGNPFFSVEFLRSLVNRGLVRYSVKEKHCIWDEGKIREETVTDNVLHLLSAKMNAMPSIQSALTVASCFGVCLSSDVAKCLSGIPEHKDFERNLDAAAKEGFMERSGADYRFVHDRVREAAYNRLPIGERNRFHYQLGISIYNTTPKDQMVDDMIFVMVDQINRGGPSSIGSPELVNVIELNYDAAARAMSSTNYFAAISSLSTGAKLLHTIDDHWTTHYDLSRRLFLLWGNAALACGHMDEAADAVNCLIENGRCIDDTLDAYYLLALLLHAQHKAKQAYSTCLDVLTKLGETIPTSVDLDQIFTRVYALQSVLAKKTDDELLDIKDMQSESKLALMQFYSQIHFIAYFLNPDNGLLHFFACRLMELCLEHGMSKYAARAFNQFGMMLGGNTIKDTEGSYRLGKLALRLVLKFNATDQLPKVYLQYYGYIAVHREPFQSCAEMLRQGHQIGLSIGDFSTGLLNGLHYIQKALISGTNLPVLKREAEYQARLIDRHSQSMSKSYMNRFQDTIRILIENGSSVQGEDDDEDGRSDYAEAALFHNILRSFWKGHFERCNFYAEKYSESFTEFNKIKDVLILFYHGLVSFRCEKKRKVGVRKRIAKDALRTVSAAAKESQWNYSGKVHLLQAELHSYDGHNEKAESVYDSAIESSRQSKFVHEEGLACELAALHYKKAKKTEQALAYFDRARACYKEWGSRMKVNYVTNQMDMLSASVP